MESKLNNISRRSFLQKSKAAGAAATAFTIIKPELVRGAGKEKLKAGLVAAAAAERRPCSIMMRGTENVDVVCDGRHFRGQAGRLAAADPECRRITIAIADRIKVDAEHRFVGLRRLQESAGVRHRYRDAGDAAGLSADAFRSCGGSQKHVFCEKPFGTDPVNVRRFMAAAKKSEELKLTVMSGAQRRNDKNYVETVKKIQDGAIGDVVATYAYWVGTPVIQQPNGRNPSGAT